MSASVEDLVNEIPNPPKDLIASERRDLETVRRWVDWILVGVDRLNRQFYTDSDAVPVVRELVLQNAFLACVNYLHGSAEVGKASLVHAWIDSSLMAGPRDDSRILAITLLKRKVKVELKPEDAELLAIFNVAVGERLLAERSAWQGRQVIRDLITRLGLNLEEVSAMFQVPPETLEGWESGRTTIAKEKLALIQAASSALSRLMAIFRPERLPQVIRRTAELFDDRTAADWIMEGRITEVAERYEHLLAYQA